MRPREVSARQRDQGRALGAPLRKGSCGGPYPRAQFSASPQLTNQTTSRLGVTSNISPLSELTIRVLPLGKRCVLPRVRLKKGLPKPASSGYDQGNAWVLG